MLVPFILGVLAAVTKCNDCVGHGQLVLKEASTVKSDLSIFTSRRWDVRVCSLQVPAAHK